ncbi:MAG: AEC family transporter [Chthoniobacteraceae bacterium]|nr:AEC family transporter [Chthoniobacteraceae bacterium]
MLSAVFAAIAPVFVIILAGFWVRRSGILSEEADASLMRIYVNLLYPCLIANKILGNEALHQSVNLWLPPLAGAATMGVGFVFCWLGARLLRIPRGPSTRTFTYVTGAYNYVYTAVPVIGSLFGDKTLGVLFLFNLGTEVAFWVGTGLILANSSGMGLWRRIFNVPVVTVLASVALNFLHVREIVSRGQPWILDALQMLGNSAIPLALLLTGAVITDFLADARPSWADAKAFGGACFLRLGFLPLTFLALACLLPCSLELKQVLIVQAAMPAGMLPVALCKHHGGDVGLSVQIVIGTTAIALLTIPHWISLGWRLAL